jgi:ATP-dependent DNA helicase RecG
MSNMNVFLPRNPLIAEVCYRVGYIDSWGRGIEKIVESCAQAGLPQPVLFEDSGGVSVELLKSQKAESATETSSPKGSPKSSPKTSERILQLICNDSQISTATIAEELGISKRAVIKQTNKLQENGQLTRVGPAKGGRWEVIESDEG